VFFSDKYKLLQGREDNMGDSTIKREVQENVILTWKNYRSEKRGKWYWFKDRSEETRPIWYRIIKQ